MADEDESSKTEEPSERKIEKAREEGHVPMSQEVKSWIMLFGGLLVVWAIFPFMMKNTGNLLYRFIAAPDEIAVSPADVQTLMIQVVSSVGLILLLPLSILFIMAIVATVAQIGFLYAPKRLSLKWERLNLPKNLKNFISLQKIFETIKGFLKIGAVVITVAVVVFPQMDMIPVLPTMEMYPILHVMYRIVFMMLLTVVIVMFIIAVIDLIYQRLSFRKKQRMTKQEVKDEYKQMEGDPQVKSRIRSIRMEKFRKRMMQAVPSATVVVTNPTHFAVALKYDGDEMDAPKVVAKGVDFLAQKIKELAKENDVPIVENPPLARALYASVEVDEVIPPEHFKAVAEVISYVFKMKKVVKR